MTKTHLVGLTPQTRVPDNEGCIFTTPRRVSVLNLNYGHRVYKSTCFDACIDSEVFQDPILIMAESSYLPALIDQHHDIDLIRPLPCSFVEPEAIQICIL